MRKLNEISVGAAEITHLPAAPGKKNTSNIEGDRGVCCGRYLQNAIAMTVTLITALCFRKRMTTTIGLASSWE